MISERFGHGQKPGAGEFERHLLHNGYIDETTQSGPRFLAIGGIVVPRKYANDFENAILLARGKRLPPQSLGWKHPRKLNGGRAARGFEAYKNVVDAFFDFEGTLPASTANTCRFHCAVVDTHVPGKSYSAGEKAKPGSVWRCISTAPSRGELLQADAFPFLSGSAHNKSGQRSR